MQEKIQKISPVKQRILLFADKIGISKREFYTKIGVSRGTLEAKTGITEDVLTKFFATYPEVSIPWVMTGEGEMFHNTNDVLPNQTFSLKTDTMVAEQNIPLYDFPVNIQIKLDLIILV